MSATLGNRIRELRTIANMSQEELGKRVGVQRAAINKYEKGSVTNIPIHTIEKIAIVFDVSPTYLVGWDDYSRTNRLAVEVRILQGLKKFYGKEAVDLVECLVLLNKTGKKRLLQYADELMRIYQA